MFSTIWRIGGIAIVLIILIMGPVLAVSSFLPSAGQAALQSQQSGISKVFMMDVLRQISHPTTEGSANRPIWSPDGDRLAYVSDRDGNLEIYVQDAHTLTEYNLTQSTADDAHPVWSPDGSKLAFLTASDNGRILQIVDSENNITAHDPNNRRFVVNPVWSGDSARIAYIAQEENGRAQIEIYTLRDDSVEVVKRFPPMLEDIAWSPDQKTILYILNGQLFAYDLTNDTWEHVFKVESFRSVAFAWSPDGSKVSFVSRRDRNYEIYVLDMQTMEVTNVSNDPELDKTPTWYDNETLIFVSRRQGSLGIYSINIHDLQPYAIANHPGRDSYMAWKPGS